MQHNSTGEMDSLTEHDYELSGLLLITCFSFLFIVLCFLQSAGTRCDMRAFMKLTYLIPSSVFVLLMRNFANRLQVLIAAQIMKHIYTVLFTQFYSSIAFFVCESLWETDMESGSVYMDTIAQISS